MDVHLDGEKAHRHTHEHERGRVGNVNPLQVMEHRAHEKRGHDEAGNREGFRESLFG